MPSPKRVGIVGFGHLGKFLFSAIAEAPDLEVVFVWNRSAEPLAEVDQSLICHDLENFNDFTPDLVVEVAHPDISKQHGAMFLQYCDYLIGSPTALADPSIEAELRGATGKGGLYIPAGALWGGPDIRKMADMGTLKSVAVTMKKHPSCFKLKSPLLEANAAVTEIAQTLYEGPVRELCPLAPNNVNTMAAAAVAAHNLGFDRVIGTLVSDPSLSDRHIVEVIVEAHSGLSVRTERVNPAAAGVVTGNATFNSFLASVSEAGGKGSGVHLC